MATLIWGVIMIAIAMASSQWRTSVFEMGLSIASVAFGSLLGTFLLGVLTRGANENGSIVGMITGLAVMIYVWKETKIAFTWWVLIGTVVTFCTGYLASLAWPAPSRDEDLRAV